MSDILFLVVKILTAIGDAVIFIAGFFIKKIIGVFKMLLKFTKATLGSLRNLAGIISQKLPANIALNIKKKLSKPFPKKRLRKKREIYSLKKAARSFSFIAKLRYFILGFLFSFLFIFIPLLSLIFIQELPSPRSLSLRQIPQTTKIYDRNGILLYQIYANQNRTLVPLSVIPAYLKQATIAIEDKNFYHNPGVDFAAIIRAAINDLEGKSLEGGSTLTQQLIKSSLLTPKTNMMRKIKEAILALWAEKIYTKNQILEMYFNQIPYGGTAWGVQAAAQTYFGKNVKDLDLAQSAFLAGMPRAPTLYSPFGQTPTLWKRRQKEVLDRMAALKYITKQQEKKALSEKLTFRQPENPIRAPHFSMYIKDLLIKKYGLPMVEKGGLKVVTSLDLKLQDKAQEIVSKEVAKDNYLNLTNGAALITNPENGDILAMVGSHDYNDPNGGQVNVTTSFRQPGSSIKAVMYSAALSDGFTAATILNDSPVTYFSPGAPPYSPVNYDHRFHGKVSLRIAFANSFNVPAVKTLNRIGIPAMVAMAKKMGIKSWGNPKQYGLSLTLGAADVTMLDMANVYDTLANQGVRVSLNPLLKVTDARGDVLEEKAAGKFSNKTWPWAQNQNPGKRVLDPGVAFIISNILADNNARSEEFGLNSPLFIPGHTVSVKTGTSDNIRDNWTIGYTPNWVVTVWVGNDNNSPMQGLVSGITGAAPIWHSIMAYLLNIKPEKPIPVPSDVIEKPCLGRMEYFIRGTENSVNCAYIAPTPSPQK
ncbi:penicillin-binding protein [Patescibacteria group bacterium]|nr:penicillin-binding protein [Patescibacteria group bacterium]MCL5010492.1 penicillin-binding protein [Patescibacteria group bacterium]